MHLSPQINQAVYHQSLLYVFPVVTMVMPSQHQPVSNIEEMELLVVVQVMVLLLYE